MSNFYKVITVIKDALLNDAQVNTVSFGSFWDLDTSKQTIYSIANIDVDSIELIGNVNRYNLSIILADIVDDSKKKDTNQFLRNNNLQDILATQVTVANILVDRLSRGDLMRDKFQLIGTVTLEMFEERFDNLLAGVAFQIQVEVPNNITIC